MNNSKISPATNSNSDFFKSLEERYLKKSENTVTIKTKNKNGTQRLDNSIMKKKGQKREKQKILEKSKPQKKPLIKQQIYLEIGDRDDQEQLKNALMEYDVCVMDQKKQLLIEKIVGGVRKNEYIWTNIQIDIIGEKEDNSGTKTNLMRQLCQNLIKSLNKAAISIYSKASPLEKSTLSDQLQNSMSTHSSFAQVYDMLSIRKQVKQDPKTLVKTNITSNAKSHLIIKKLLDFAHERQIMMNKQFLVSQVSVRIQPHRSLENQQNQQIKSIQPIVELKVKQKCLCKTDFMCECPNKIELGEIKQDFLMKGMKINYKIYRVGEQESVEQILSVLSAYKRAQKEQTEEQLVKKIKKLQQELMNNKKQLEIYKGKVRSINTEGQENQSNYRVDEDDPDDLILPSERAYVDIGRYNHGRQLLGSKK